MTQLHPRDQENRQQKPILGTVLLEKKKQLQPVEYLLMGKRSVAYCS